MTFFFVIRTIHAAAITGYNMPKNRDNNYSNIRGNTLKVYLYVLKHGKSELRDIQHELDFSSASLASYHLNKLIHAGYVGQDDLGRYQSIKDVSGEILEGYTRVGTTIVPQFFFLALLFSVVLGYFSFEALQFSYYVPYLVIGALASVALLWFETIRLWRKLVTWR